MDEGMPEPGLRASDAERETARERLAEHMAAGRITMEEYHERADAILAARTRAELEAPFQDLPRPAPPVPAVPAPAAVRPAQRAQRAIESVAAVVGSASLLIFFVLGFAFNAWSWAWLVFLVPGIVGGGAWSEHRHDRRLGRRR